DEVVVVDDLSTGRLANLAGVGAELVKGSILDAGLLDEVVPGAGAIIPLAARPSVPRSLEDPMASHEANATGTMRVLEAARRHDRPQVVVASSSSVYGANPELPKREDMVAMPVSPYAVSKLAAESYALAYQHSFGVPVLAFRFFNVFGPLQPAGHAYAAVVPTFVSCALTGRPLPIHGDGSQTRDFTFVDTVVAVLAEAIRRRVTDPEPVNLAFGSRSSLLELITALEEAVGHPLHRDHLEPRAGDVHDSQADRTRLGRLFPEVRPTPLPEGLRATLAWFRESR
ncbi:MAG TPA: NAD-dependent epimerase/dehydratase family protein, partial [Acidimicrobiales bacterium]|nr:NAD-dependent epimerase/dehydratase family protein [Acidimicrobiales bacterium]